MSILRTRYRDIPFDQISQSHGLASRGDDWERVRGTEILVGVPAEHLKVDSNCGQPMYRRLREDGTQYANPYGYPVAVCPCIAEIGD